MGKIFQALNKAKREDSTRDATSSERQKGGSGDGVIGRDRGENLGANESRRLEKEERRPSELVDGLKKVDVSPADWDEKIITFFDQSSGLSENIRRLRSKIIHASADKPFRKILVTSIGAGEGKSFISALLGISIAQGLDDYALLVDCDLRRPKLASLFNVRASRGLSTYLANDAELGAMMMTTGMRKLSIIPSGPPPVNPAELLGSEKVGRMFSELDNRYDDRVIIIDTPPLGVASESAVLAQHADAIVLIVRWGRAGRDQVKTMVETLGREKILGVVFNAYEDSLLSRKVSGYYGYTDQEHYKL